MPQTLFDLKQKTVDETYSTNIDSCEFDPVNFGCDNFTLPINLINHYAD